VLFRFSLDLPLFGLGPSSKGLGSNLWLSANKISLFHWTLNTHQKWPYDKNLHHGPHLCS
jgi:hypothetical protein